MKKNYPTKQPLFLCLLSPEGCVLASAPWPRSGCGWSMEGHLQVRDMKWVWGAGRAARPVGESSKVRMQQRKPFARKSPEKILKCTGRSLPKVGKPWPVESSNKDFPHCLSLLLRRVKLFLSFRCQFLKSLCHQSSLSVYSLELLLAS